MPLIDSTAIRRVEWADGWLLVWFADGDCYAYAGVPEAVYRGLLGAGSAGAFFTAHVRDQYPTQLIR